MLVFIQNGEMLAMTSGGAPYIQGLNP
jgi:hypothetical protein